MSTAIVRLFLAFIIFLVLTIIPLPAIFSLIRPAWVVLLLLYTQSFFPKYFRVSLAFLLGLYLDVLSGSIMGEHAFAILITTWFASGRVHRFKYYSMIHQMSMIALFCLLYQCVLYVIDAFLGHAVFVWQVVGVPITSILIWPWLCMLIPVRTRQAKSSQWSYYDL